MCKVCLEFFELRFESYLDLSFCVFNLWEFVNFGEEFAEFVDLELDGVRLFLEVGDRLLLADTAFHITRT